jgi:multiple sugar transport system permease protein
VTAVTDAPSRPARPAGAPPPRRTAGAKPEPYILLGPAVVLVLVFAGYPLVRSIYFGFNKINPLRREISWTGLTNLKDILTDSSFGPLMGRTGIWVFGIVALQFLFGLGMALLLNTHFPLRGVYRGLVMVPWATPSVLVALMWKWILDPNNGILNDWIRGLGLADRPVEFLSSSSLALPTVMLVDVWQGIPLFAVMILAALQSVSGDLKEAAAVDGCGAVRTFFHVILPAIVPTLLITTVLRLVWTANYVDLIYILTGGGPGESSTTLALESYLTAYKATDFGHGAAYAVVQACCLAVFIALYLRLTSRQGQR